MKGQVQRDIDEAFVWLETKLIPSLPAKLRRELADVGTQNDVRNWAHNVYSLTRQGDDGYCWKTHAVIFSTNFRHVLIQGLRRDIAGIGKHWATDFAVVLTQSAAEYDLDDLVLNHTDELVKRLRATARSEGGVAMRIDLAREARRWWLEDGELH